MILQYKGFDWVDKSTVFLIILQFALIHYVNNAPEWMLMTNVISIVVGGFFLLSNILHHKSRRVALFSIPAVALFCYATTDNFLQYYGSVVCLISMILNWTFFDQFYSKSGQQGKGWFFKDRRFWVAATGSNVMCAFASAVAFSFAVEAAPPPISPLWCLLMICSAFVIATVFLLKKTYVLRPTLNLLAVGLFASIVLVSPREWTDPFAVDMLRLVCGSCAEDPDLAWVTDMITTGLFKSFMPAFGFWLYQALAEGARNG